MADETKKILIVEDTPSIMKAAQFALEEAGFHVDMAVDGNEALEKIEANAYDVILLDLVMPGKTGFEVLNILKHKGNKIPILVYSNMMEEISKEEVLRLGARDYFAKAKISLDELVEKVKKYTKS